MDGKSVWSSAFRRRICEPRKRGTPNLPAQSWLKHFQYLLNQSNQFEAKRKKAADDQKSLV
jgi:hypothetical protein